MIRTVFFLILVGVLALGVGWLADRPGGVEIVWLNHRISTSVAMLVAAMALLAVLSILVWSLLRALWRAPRRLVHARRSRRAARGQRAIALGLIAIGAGDARAAARHAAEAKRLASDEPLGLLLRAQAAQLAGDRTAADETFGAMVARSDTKLLGLHGLFVEAQRRDDRAAARALAEEAAKAAPGLAWAGRAVLEFRCAADDWPGAIAALERNKANRLIDNDAYRRQRAVLLTAQAQTLADSDRDRAKAAALEAAKLAPDLVPAVALASRFLAEAGETRKAMRMLEAAWRSGPHPDLAEAYMNVRPSDSARERLARAQKLVRHSADHTESALALARAALDAQAYDVARTALAPLAAKPTQRVAMLMAELEEAESGDIGRARAWTARAVRAARDPAWTADSVVSETWKPLSPVSGRLDAFEWKVPLAELAGPVIETEAVAPPPVPPAVAPPALPQEEARAEATGEGAAPEAPPAPSSGTVATTPERRAADNIVPLVHAPDDPGPDHEPEIEPTPKAESWPRLRALFR